MFSDPTSVVRNELSSFSRTPCQRCGVSFDPEGNNVNSCTFHANEDGEPGTFLLGKGGGWTCCGETWEGAPGCNSRPHIGKELAIVATIESLPKLMCGQSEVSIYKHIGFTFYPGVKRYTSNMQITKAIAELFMAYFMGEGVVEKGQKIDRDEGGGTDVVDGIKSGLDSALTQVGRVSELGVVPGLTGSTTGGSEGGAGDGGERRGILFGSRGGGGGGGGEFNSRGGGGGGVKVDVGEIEDDEEESGKEVVYISHLR